MKLEAARLEIAAGRVTVLSPEGDSVVDFSAEMNDVGLVPIGTLRFRSDRLQLDPLFRLAGLSVPEGAPRLLRRVSAASSWWPRATRA